MKKNRLIEAVESTLVDNAKKLQFTYDYKGRRIQKQVYAWDAASDLWSLTSDLRYVYDGWNLIEVLDATDSNSVAKTYTWGLDLSQSLQGAGGVGGLLAVIEHGETADTPYYATYDANGNISEYLKSDGSVAVHYEYSPFGRLTLVDSETGAPDFNHRFSTKYQDSETELYYYGYRYYSSELGRWLNRDPIGEKGGVNLYGFVGNCPVVEADRLGLFNWQRMLVDFLIRQTVAAGGNAYTDPLASLTIELGYYCEEGKTRFLIYEIEKQTKLQVSAFKSPVGTGRLTLHAWRSHSVVQVFKCLCEKPSMTRHVETQKTEWEYMGKMYAIPFWKRQKRKVVEKIAEEVVDNPTSFSPRASSVVEKKAEEEVDNTDTGWIP